MPSSARMAGCSPMTEVACPTPQKKSYATRETAVFFARADGLRAYLCPCGLWHLSSKVRAGKRMGIGRRQWPR